MSHICQAFLDAELADVSEVQTEYVSPEAEALALLPSDFYIYAEVECAYCKDLIDLMEAKIAREAGFACFCQYCQRYANFSLS